MVAFNNFFVVYTLKSIKAINIDFRCLHCWSVKQQVVQYSHMSHINYDYVYSKLVVRSSLCVFHL